MSVSTGHQQQNDGVRAESLFSAIIGRGRGQDPCLIDSRLTPAVVMIMRNLRDHGWHCRAKDSDLNVYDMLVAAGWISRGKWQGRETYQLTLAGYEITGRRVGNDLSWQVEGGRLRDLGRAAASRVSPVAAATAPKVRT